MNNDAIFEKPFRSFHPHHSDFFIGFSVRAFGFITPKFGQLRHAFRRKDLDSLHFVLRGSGYIERKGTILKVQAGQCFLLRGGDNAIYYQNAADPWVCVWVDIAKTSSLDVLYKTIGIASDHPVPFADEDYLVRFINELLEEKNDQKLPYFDARWLEAFCHLFPSRGIEKEEAKPKNRKLREDKLASEIARYIENHFRDPDLTIRSLSEEFHYSHAHLTRVFHNKNDMSPVAYLTQVRMEEAEVLLVNGNPVTKVAEAVGFHSVPYFSKVFKNYFGHSPIHHKQFKP